MKNQEHPALTDTFANDLCMFYLQIEDFEHATQLAEKMLEEDSENYTALLVLGLISEEKENFQLALYYYDTILKSHANDSVALKRKASVEMNIKKETSALNDITRSLQLNSEDAEAYIIRGLIYFYLFQKKIEAIIDYNQALRLEPNNVYALFNRGYAYLKYGNHNYARDDFERAAHLGYGYASEMLDRYFSTQGSYQPV